VSMPLRWSQGTMQVRVEAALLPPALAGQSLTGLRLRRPTFLGEPAYAALTRTLTVRGAFEARFAAELGNGLAANRPANVVTLFGPAPLAVAATPAQAAGTAVGAEYVVIPFAAPLPVVANQALFLEFEASTTPFQVGADHWVDAVWFENGNESGYAVTLGAGTCTTRSVPSELTWTEAAGPRVGSTALMRLTGAPPTNATSLGFALAWFGIAPEPRAPSASYVGFGGSLGSLDPGLVGCHQWAPIDASWIGGTDAAGTFGVTFPLAAGATAIGMRIGVQSAWLDVSRPGLPLSVSNGVALVLNDVGVRARCATVYFPGAASTSPWFTYIGQMPVLVLEY
jgi:hypothetical protein